MSTSDFVDVEEMLFNHGFYDAKLGDIVNYPAVSPVVTILNQKRNGLITELDYRSKIDSLKKYDVRNDIRRYFYRRSINQQYSLNMNGGGDRHTYYLSVNWDKNNANVKKNDYDRLVLSLQQSFLVFKGLQLTSGIVYTKSTQNFNNSINDIRLSNFYSIYPYARLVDDAGSPIPIVKDFNRAFVEQSISRRQLDWNFVPINELNSNENSFKISDIRAFLGLKYPIAKSLDVEVKYQYERQVNDNDHIQGANSYYTRNLINTFSSNIGNSIKFNVPIGDIYDRQNSVLSSYNLRGQLNYNRKWKKNGIAAIAGLEFREAKVTGTSNRFYGYDASLGVSNPVNYDSLFTQYPTGVTAKIPYKDGFINTVDRFRSYFINASYSYDNRYNVSVSARKDESNLFGVKSNQKGVPLWSSGVAWNISNEKFYGLKILPLLKVRFTYGYNGNYDNTITAYTTAYGGLYSSYTGKSYAIITNPPNENLRWEKIGMYNIGVDFQAKNQIIFGSIEYYRKKGVDLIGTGPIDPTSGIAQFKGNIADMTGSGWDLDITSQNINRAFKWSTSIQYSFVADKVKKYELKPSMQAIFTDASYTGMPSDINPIVGKPLFGIYSFRSAGLDPQTGDPRGYVGGKSSSDYFGILNSTLYSNTPSVDSFVFHGRALPSSFGALRNSFSYKGIQFSFNITYKFGYYFRRPSINYSNLFDGYQTHADYERRWKRPGDERITEVPSLIYPSNSFRDFFYLNSEDLVEKGDHIRLQDINLSYTIERSNMPSLPISSIQFYLYVNNIGVLWSSNSHGIDPDYLSGYPTPKSYSVGLRAKF